MSGKDTSLLSARSASTASFSRPYLEISDKPTIQDFDEMAAAFGGHPGVQTLPATRTWTGTARIAETAFASTAVFSNVLLRSEITEVTNGIALPFRGSSSMCQSEPPRPV